MLKFSATFFFMMLRHFSVTVGTSLDGPTIAAINGQGFLKGCFPDVETYSCITNGNASEEFLWYHNLSEYFFDLKLDRTNLNRATMQQFVNQATEPKQPLFLLYDVDLSVVPTTPAPRVKVADVAQEDINVFSVSATQRHNGYHYVLWIGGSGSGSGVNSYQFASISKIEPFKNYTTSDGEVYPCMLDGKSENYYQMEYPWSECTQEVYRIFDCSNSTASEMGHCTVRNEAGTTLTYNVTSSGLKIIPGDAESKNSQRAVTFVYQLFNVVYDETASEYEVQSQLFANQVELNFEGNAVEIGEATLLYEKFIGPEFVGDITSNRPSTKFFSSGGAIDFLKDNLCFSSYGSVTCGTYDSKTMSFENVGGNWEAINGGDIFDVCPNTVNSSPMAYGISLFEPVGDSNDLGLQWNCNGDLGGYPGALSVVLRNASTSVWSESNSVLPGPYGWRMSIQVPNPLYTATPTAGPTPTTAPTPTSSAENGNLGWKLSVLTTMIAGLRLINP